MKRRVGRTLVVLGATMLAFLAAGCKEDTPCDEGQTLINNYCQDTPPPTVIGDEWAAFEHSCQTDADCVAPTNYCALAVNKCTATGCETNPAVCPPSWSCFDLSPYGTAVHVCAPPM
jgi:hypothetical protein